MSTLSELQAIRATLFQERSLLTNKIKDIEKQIEAVCDHDWRWSQVAGEGRYCTKCTAVDYSED